LIQKVKKLLYRLLSLALDTSRSANLLASLLRHRDQISAFLITDVRTTVRKRLLFTSDDPCINDITRVQNDSRHDTFRYILALLVLFREYTEWKRQNCGKSGTVKKFATFKGFKKRNIAQHGITDGKKLHYIINDYRVYGLTVLLSFENHKWRNLVKGEVTEFTNLCRGNDYVHDFAQS
jgi:hypothetical protein